MTPQEVMQLPSLSPESMQDIIEIYPDAAWSPFPWLWLALGVAGLLMALAGYCFYRHLRKRATPLPAETAQERLQTALAELQRLETADAQRFYAQSRAVLNAYCRWKWNRDVEALTSAELAGVLAAIAPEAVESIGTDLIPIIGRYEQSLFAGQEPSVAARQQDLAILRSCCEP